MTIPASPGAPGGDRVPLVDTHAHLQDQALRGDLVDVLHGPGGRACRGHRRRYHRGRQQQRWWGSPARSRRLRRGRRPPEPRRGGRPGDWERVVDLAGAPGSSRWVRRDSTGTGTPRRSTSSKTGSTATSPSPANGDLPVIIHCRDCERDLIDQLAALAAGRGVLHSFTGSWDDAQAFLELGLHMSFAGW